MSQPSGEHITICSGCGRGFRADDMVQIWEPTEKWGGHVFWLCLEDPVCRTKGLLRIQS